MPQRRRVARAAVFGAATAACLAIASPALATDPAGNNGTVKIDHSIEVDNHNDPNIANRPHVACDFKVRFFGFDKDQTADIAFTIHPPSGNGETLLSETKTVSDDDASGAKNDEDLVVDYSAATWGLDRFKEHEKQGYHVKLTITSDGVPGGVKHKVFWIQGCKTPTTPSSPPPTTSTPPSSSPPPTNGNGGGGGEGDEGGLPVTGAAATTMALLGTALIGGGAGLVWLRRRRDNVTFTS